MIEPIETKLAARFVCRNQLAPDSIVGLKVEIIEDGPCS
jgi:hypothetical protein